MESSNNRSAAKAKKEKARIWFCFSLWKTKRDTVVVHNFAHRYTYGRRSFVTPSIYSILYFFFLFFPSLPTNLISLMHFSLAGLLYNNITTVIIKHIFA